jgi:hypothetical protein
VSSIVPAGVVHCSGKFSGPREKFSKLASVADGVSYDCESF